ncbi:unnamed protein product [Urochloa decumbens]|uniref:Receptor-like serine/threonine-protein kinase n=1 Tax=Urochloa decumbens TaxID=240449 RepID=A0ABC9CZE6_9POAL
MAPLFLLSLLLLLLLSFTSVHAQQNITLGSSQGPSNFWLSPSGDFAFGFRPIEGNTSSYLLSVWFSKISNKTVAWYAKTSGPEPAPIQVTSGSRLQLTLGGTLSLLDPINTEAWTPQSVGVAAYASMLDTGNFVLVAADGTTKWGTFKDPADTILPTQVLTPGMTLHSRIIATDYSNGRFILNIQTDGVFLYPVAVPSGFQYDSYWSTVGNTTRLVFDSTGRIYITLDNSTQTNMTLGAIGSMADYYNRATLDPDGVFRQYAYPKKASNQWSQAWSVVGMEPQNICLAMTKVGSGTCGFNSYCMLDSTTTQTTCMCPTQYSFIDEERKYKGCKPDFQTQSCDLDEEEAMKQFKLTTMYHVNWPLADYEQYSPITENQCPQLCLTDCFCAVAVFYDGGSTFLIKVPTATNNNTQSQLSKSSKWKKDKKYWIFGSSLLLGSSVLLVLVLICILLLGPNYTIVRKAVPSLQSSSNLGLPLKAFTYAELEKATGGFQEVLGTGASGIVYKGQLQDQHGTCIAVKKIDKIEQESEKEFTAEVQVIGQTHHKNLVRLLGLCNEGKERLLIYEFMSNGSLNRILFGDVKLQWNLRVQLALGIARGLLYLHEECSTQIIHCDIKPQNILLDDNCIAKISDFGLAKLLRTNQTQTNTGIRGTRGYVAPEWFKSVAITAKVDVYSFGVILLELICCRRNVELEATEEDQKILTDWANDSYRCGRVDFLVEGDDEAICNLKVVERFVAVALWCLQEDPTMRPTMLKVTQMLDGVVAIPTPADPPSSLSLV